MTDIDIAGMKNCTVCAEALPLPPKPIFQFGHSAPILIAGQAPGRITHYKGRPFDDPSGERLRDWLGVTRRQFYNARNFNIVPMGFCYPGTMPKQGDKPPRQECRDRWHLPMKARLMRHRLILAIGLYAHEFYLPAFKSLTVAEKCRQSWRDHIQARAKDKETKNKEVKGKEARENKAQILALPHPSPRNNLWLKKNSWFEGEVVPYVRHMVKGLLDKDA